MTAIQLMKPTIGGRVPLVIGRAVYGIPRGSRVAHVSLGRKRLAWVNTYGQIRAFVEGGEVGPIPEPLQQLVREQIFHET